MAAAMLSQKSTRIIFAALFAVVFLNVSFFFYESAHGGEFESSLKKLASVIPGGSSKNPEAEVVIKKSVYRQYFDDRSNGLLVLSHSEGASWDEKDPETLRFQKMMKTQEKEFTVFEITPFNPDTDILPAQEADADSEGGLIDDEKEGPKELPNPIVEFSDFQRTFISFFSNIMKHVDENKPTISGINNDAHYKKAREEKGIPNREGRMPTYGGHWRESYTKEPVRTFEYLKYFLRLGDDEVRALKGSHDNYLKVMKKEIPENLLKFGRDFGFMRGNGIVYLGGGKYNQLVLTSISVLRSLGSVMPVEVIMPKSSDFDIDLCNNIFPKLNAKCKVLEHFVPKNVMDKIGGFQLKNVALLVSSFKNVLYLDADNIPVKNPDILFVNEPFKSSHMVIWPDLWRRSTSPLYYEIADINVDKSFQARNSYFKGDGRGKSSDPFRISYHDLKGTIPEASSETGQMMINKEKHFSTLILSMYYNFYGPDYYYPLFSQGAAGEGDKETFIAAAHKLGLPYYQVTEFNREFGPIGKNNKREYFGMGQYDPIIDYAQSNLPDKSNAPVGDYAFDQEDSSKDNYDFHYYKSSSLMFLHANWPKFYLAEMFERNSFGRGPKDADNKRRRLYSEYILKETDNFDIELHIMKHIEQWACDTQINLADLPKAGSEGRKKICEEIEAHIDFLIAT